MFSAHLLRPADFNVTVGFKVEFQAGELSVLAVRQSLVLILGGPYTLVFWVLFMGLGLLAPLAIEVFEFAPPRHDRRIAGAAAVMVLFGGYLLRYVFVYAGQASSFR